MTGVNPGKHNIFDFLNRNPRNYIMELSSSRVEQNRRDKKPVVRLLRKSKPFWHVLGDYGVFSTILRVPITFPAEKFKGLCLSGMCVPDLRGSQGSFTCYTTASVKKKTDAEGMWIQVRFEGDRATAALPGPPGRDGKPVSIPVRIRRVQEKDGLVVELSGQRVRLRKGVYSRWISIRFPIGRTKKVSGICRLLWVADEPAFKLYVTPLNIDPAKPSMPVSSPAFYSIYLGKLHGPFATLGLAEDTWARSEGVIDDRAFLQQVYDIHNERERMFLDALDRTRQGVCVCVFDTSDRIQHMFIRDASATGKDEFTTEDGEAVLEQMYMRMDKLVGQVQQKLKGDDVLMVISDHGFTSFRRGVDLNNWLRTHGYLTVKDEQRDAPYLQNIDWGNTRAYAFGLSGIYLNLKGREGQGTVLEEEAPALKKELMEQLRKLQDPETGQSAIHAVYDADDVYRGPYKNHGPDLVIGFEKGYRASWEAAAGRACGPLFSDNEEPWSGDHCVDVSQVPGVLFCNRKIDEDALPRLMDIGPTVLECLGVPRPAYMDGEALPVQHE
jgi:predicted AlkP superfamily phosphohydrolase/phosphomutase